MIDVMTDGKSFFDQPVKSDMRTYDNIQKMSTGEKDDHTAGCLLDYNYFKKYYKMIATDLVKQQELDSNPKVIQQIHFTGNLKNQSKLFFIIDEAKKIVLDFSQGTVKLF